VTKHITKEMLSVANMPDTSTARKVLAKMLDDDDIQEYIRPWVGLTDEEILKNQDIVENSYSLDLIEFAKAIEAKLKEKNNG
jgi:hypothetical protein